MPDVLCVGSCSLDAFLGLSEEEQYVSLDRQQNRLCLPYGAKIPLKSCEFLAGGNACNVAVGLSRLGFQIELMAEIGEDSFGEQILQTLAQEGVGISFLQKKGRSSFAVSINYQGDRTLLTEHRLREHNFSFTSVKTGWLYLTSLGERWQEAYANVLSFVQETKTKLAFNPGTAQLHGGYQSLLPILKATDLLFLNLEEAKALVSQKTSSKENFSRSFLLRALQEIGAKTVILTDSKNGSCVRGEKGREEQMDSIECPVVEKTGAGDAYASGFLASFLLGQDIKTAMMWGSLNAASVIGFVGAQKGLLKRESLITKGDLQ